MSRTAMPSERITSYYSATVRGETNYPSLQGDVETDICIIGGGFSGIAAAVEFAERGLRVVVLESHKVGWGQSGRNGGQVTGSLSGEGAMRKQMRKRLGAAVDDFIWDLRWRGHDIIRQRIGRYGIDCDLKFGHLHTAMKPAHMSELRTMEEEAQRRGMGAHVTLLDAHGVRDHLESTVYCGGLKNTRNMHLHPLNLCIGEARAAQGLGTQIFEHTEVTGIEHGERPQVTTRHGRVRAAQVLLAGDVYHQMEKKKLGGMIFPAAGGIVTTRPLDEATARAINPYDLAVYDCRFVLDYYRLTADRRLLLGGGANYSGRESRDIAAEMRPAIEKIFPRLKGIEIEFAWSCNMGIVINRIPQLGKLSPNVWYAQGYSGHGLATTHIVAQIMAEAMTGTLERYDTFADCTHVRVPLGEYFGNPLLTIGMWYYQMLEKMR
jgi:gamma-glutamylputrescine oxidase